MVLNMIISECKNFLIYSKSILIRTSLVSGIKKRNHVKRIIFVNEIKILGEI